MKKIYITGGDNVYCGECGGVCDRLVMEVDTTNKTLKYIPTKGSLCLGKWCWEYSVDKKLGGDYEGWELCRDKTIKISKWSKSYATYKYYATNGEKTIPVVVKNNKWGKDGEYDTLGSLGGGETEDAYLLERFKSIEKCHEWERDLGNEMKPHDHYFELTGWKLLKQKKGK